MIRTLVGLFALCLAAGAQAQEYRVTLSDNLLVLDDQNRSATIDMVNFSEDPMDFSMKVHNEFNGAAPDGTPLVRWNPARALVPASQSVAMRLASRTRPDLPAGEYEFRVGAKATVQRSPVTLIPSNDPAVPPSLSISVPLMPELPVTVYLRHGIDKPMVDVKPFVLTPADPQWVGYFPLVKRAPAISFVGVGQAIRQDTQADLRTSRIHILPRNPEGRFPIPRGAAPSEAAGAYCLRIWDKYPGKGAPTQEWCG
jgi:hypothetical protein